MNPNPPTGDSHRSPDESTPLYRWYYEKLKADILQGRLLPGERLPASRILKEEWNVSRNTVTGALELLVAEGYLETRAGAGVFVAALDFLKLSRPKKQARHRKLSRRGELFKKLNLSRPNRFKIITPFRAGAPDYEKFPFKEFSRLSARAFDILKGDLMGYGAPRGYGPLRTQIKNYLSIKRNIHCDEDTIVILNGSQEALAIIAQILLDPGGSVYLEDPGYPGARNIFLAAGAKIKSLPVDREGAMAKRIDVGLKNSLYYVTPSHQFPLGTVLSLERRILLLERAAASNSLVIEDDYDSDFNYYSRPRSALFGLDRGENTVYLGTFSKSTFPGLRIGYAVLPDYLTSAFLAAKSILNRQPPILNQVILAEFMREGRFLKHLGRMKKLYFARQKFLLKELKTLERYIQVEPAHSGLHLIAYLNPELNWKDRELKERAFAAGLDLECLSRYYHPQNNARQALILGYAAFDQDTLAAGVARLKTLFESHS